MFHKLYVKSVFRHYINKKMLNKGLGNVSVLNFNGERKHITMLFSDIFTFIYYLVKQSPEETVSNLCEYFSENEGMANYKNQEWDRALGDFKSALNFKDDDLSKMYIKRCLHFKKYSPGTDWDGVFTSRIS